MDISSRSKLPSTVYTCGKTVSVPGSLIAPDLLLTTEPLASSFRRAEALWLPRRRRDPQTESRAGLARHFLKPAPSGGVAAERAARDMHFGARSPEGPGAHGAGGAASGPVGTRAGGGREEGKEGRGRGSRAAFAVAFAATFR